MFNKRNEETELNMDKEVIPGKKRFLIWLISVGKVVNDPTIGSTTTPRPSPPISAKK